MTMFYSKSTGGFYDPEINGDGIPADAVEITDAQHTALLEAQSSGQRIEADKYGHPVAVDPPTPTHDELVAQALADTRAQRQPIISILDGLQASALAKADGASATEIETAKQALRDITKVDLSACVTYDDMKAAMLTAYRAIASAAPASVQLAFAGALQ